MMHHYYLRTAYRMNPVSLVNIFYFFRLWVILITLHSRLESKKKIMANILSFHAYSSKSIYFFFLIRSLMEGGNRMGCDILVGKASEFKAAVGKKHL